MNIDPDASDTTEQDFKLFADECRKRINQLSLHNLRWDIELGDTDGAYATCNYGYGCRTVLITLSEDDLPDEDREEIIKETALHEPLEAGLLGTLILFAKDNRGISDETIEAESHSIIYRIIHMIKGYETEIKELKAEIEWLKGV